MEVPNAKLVMHPAHAQLTNKSRIIHKGPCLVTAFSVAGAGADGTADIYDGESTSGEHKCRVSVLNGTTFHWCLPNPVDFDKGLYIAVNAATTYVTVCFIPESWKKFI